MTPVDPLVVAVLVVLAALVGIVAGFIGARVQDRFRLTKSQTDAKDIVARAEKEANNLRKEAELKTKDEFFKKREEFNREIEKDRQEVREQERRLEKREDTLDQKHQVLLKKERSLDHTQRKLHERRELVEKRGQELEALLLTQTQKLHEITGLNREQAEGALLERLAKELSVEVANRIQKHEEELKATCEEKSREVLATAIQRYASEHTADTTVSTVDIPSDDMKGRIIGREGRNIRAFEAATGITVLIDDTPNAVVLSGFDPVRREVARESMQRLILDGRIHPTRIEEVVGKVTQEMEETIVHEGEAAVIKTGLPPMHPEIVKLLGRLKFRHSFSQNILDHSVEVAHLTGLLAAELGLDVTTAKRCGLLHDIGKSVNHEVEGAHALIGADFIRRCGETEEVVNAVASHHDEAPHHGPLGILVGAADAISASRPGARSETMTTHIKRMEDLERIGRSFPGVEKCFAVQAGRELRVLVQPEQVSDEQAFALARNISRKIEEGLQYPGQIRVTVVRETRCVEFAK